MRINYHTSRPTIEQISFDMRSSSSGETIAALCLINSVKLAIKGEHATPIKVT